MKLLYSVALVFVFASCKDAKNTETTAMDTTTETNISALQHPGKKIMETKCYACHDATTPEENRLAPPMAAVKRRYVMGVRDKNAFIQDFIDWSKDPTLERSKMPGAVQRFGVMPFLPYPEEDIKLIAEYLYENEIDQPDWFEEHYRQNSQGQGMGQGQGMRKGRGQGNGGGMGRPMNLDTRQGITPTDYNALGMKYALATKAQLGKNLITAIEKKGTVGAVQFCNLRAIKLTDSMATVQGVNIKRVSDKPRNPDNQADSQELEYIAAFKNTVEKGNKVSPIIDEIDDKVHYYSPITTNTMCLQCHGVPNENVTPETLRTLKALYPNDQALGYSENQVRGLWSIVFDKK